MSRIKHIHFQFRKKDYKFRHDLGGICVGYNQHWWADGDQSYSDPEYQWEKSREYFNESKMKLEIGEYFSMEVFGQKWFAYRNENGIFVK